MLMGVDLYLPNLRAEMEKDLNMIAKINPALGMDHLLEKKKTVLQIYQLKMSELLKILIHNQVHLVNQVGIMTCQNGNSLPAFKQYNFNSSMQDQDNPQQERALIELN